MERFSIECTGCQKRIGEATRQEAIPTAMAHLHKAHRPVALPHPGLDLIKLHPFYTLDVLAQTEVNTSPEAEPATQTSQPPDGEAPGGSGNGEQPGPPESQN